MWNTRTDGWKLTNQIETTMTVADMIELLKKEDPTAKIEGTLQVWPAAARVEVFTKLGYPIQLKTIHAPS